MTESQSKATGIAIVCILFSLGIVISAIIEFKGWDLMLSSALHDQRLGASGWTIGKMYPFYVFYRFGEYPAIIMAIAAFFGYILTRVGNLSRKYAKPFLVIVLTVILGPGLIVNGILKPLWGRPRPADTVIFGGAEPFRSVAQPLGPGGGKSFVCGHCANAFAIASGIALYPFFPGAASFFLGAGLTMGVLGSLARIAQGGHYLSDTVWSGIIVLSIIAWLYFCLFKLPAKSD
ncbi:MAG: phosphatase PAP2 family protein [Desulfomonilaceae bacterium]